MTGSNDGDPDMLPLAEEVASVTKRKVRTGQVTVRTITDTVQEIAQASLQSEAVKITRIAIDREVDVAPEIRTEGDLTIIPVLEEVMIVEKRLVLKEEIHVRRTMTNETVETPVTLRRQRAAIERQDDKNLPDPPLRRP